MKESLDLLKGSPIRVVCDNMLIFYDNNDKFPHDDGAYLYPNLIWNHSKEFFICVRPTPSTITCSKTLPVEFSIVPYEMIQYIQAYESNTNAISAVNKRSEFASLSREAKQVILDMISKKTM